MCACIREFKVKRSIQTLITLFGQAFLFPLFRQNYTINQNKINTRRKLTISNFINRLPQGRLTTVKRVRACESGHFGRSRKLAICSSPTSSSETRYLLFSNAKRVDIVLDKYIFSDKSTDNLHMVFLYYTFNMNCYPSDFRAPQCWKETHIFENFTFSRKNAYLFYARKSD